SRTLATSKRRGRNPGEETRRWVLLRPTSGPMLFRHGRQLRLLQRRRGAKALAAPRSEIGTVGVLLTGKGTAGEEGDSRSQNAGGRDQQGPAKPPEGTQGRLRLLHHAWLCLLPDGRRLLPLWHQRAQGRACLPRVLGRVAGGSGSHPCG